MEDFYLDDDKETTKDKIMAFLHYVQGNIIASCPLTEKYSYPELIFRAEKL